MDRLEQGKQYTEHEQSLMTQIVIGWTEGDGSGHEGYNFYDYFDANGRYKGPDSSGIEPLLAD